MSSYELVTVKDVPFSSEGPAKVVVDGWGVSYMMDSGTTSVRLNAYRVPYTGEKHAIDGSLYATVEDAKRAAYNAGLLAFMIYNNLEDAHDCTR